jgi:2-polyprenyl-3-methyl-5-hydroxy-6-metoxy-1,4-benzoquinol methylase
MRTLFFQEENVIRFEFGKNWNRFLRNLNEEGIREAENSLKRMLEMENLQDMRFLDIGSGSGLFSFAALRLGARVHSFDYDPQSAACTMELRRRYCRNDDRWTVEEGSVLDEHYLRSLGTFDIVYSWGVLHHTGDMWKALANAAIPVKVGGRFFVAIYNDQGSASRRWKWVKEVYCGSRLGKAVVISIFFPYFFLGSLAVDSLKGKNPVTRYKEYRRNRGMAVSTDWLDWLGGYPFEVAKPEDIFHFYREMGFRLERLKTCGGGLGNNEFVFYREK